MRAISLYMIKMVCYIYCKRWSWHACPKWTNEMNYSVNCLQTAWNLKNVPIPKCLLNFFLARADFALETTRLRLFLTSLSFVKPVVVFTRFPRNTDRLEPVIFAFFFFTTFFFFAAAGFFFLAAGFFLDPFFFFVADFFFLPPADFLETWVCMYRER